MAGYGGNDLSPGDLQAPVNDLVPWGDPEAYGAAQASSLMSPAVSSYFNDLVSGRIASKGIERLESPMTYQPGMTMGQMMATDPQSLPGRVHGLLLDLQAGGAAPVVLRHQRAERIFVSLVMICQIPDFGRAEFSEAVRCCLGMLFNTRNKCPSD